MKRKCFLCFVCPLILILFSIKAYGITGKEVMDKVAETRNAPADTAYEAEMILVEKDGSEKKRQIKYYLKGDDKSLMRFLSPADVKGVAFLALSDEQMYLYLPAFKKIRRIASHIKHDNFMGTDFSYEDMGETDYEDKYSAKILSEEEKEYILEAIPKEGSDVGYSKLKLWIDKERWLMDKVEFYDKKGKLLKVLTNTGKEKIQGYWTHTKMEMYNVVDQHKTIFKLIKVEYDTGLKDDFFSQRYLKRRR
jgi:outer membrane lipoprotein-sorting protein